MAQKILAGRADDPRLGSELVRVRVDQVVLARDPHRVLTEAERLGIKKPAVEVAIAYDTRCVTSHRGDDSPDSGQLAARAIRHSIWAARPGIGFAPAVHLERFGGPARLTLTDEPRLSAVGGAGMLALTAPPSQLAEALVHGSVLVRPASSVQVLLSGRVRPFVCVRDVAFELIRRGLGEIVRRIDSEQGLPVVIEFSGPGARLLSVPERAVLCAVAPTLGAAAALFVSDEKTEVYLRDQRRSKAHRGLSPDAGAPCADVLNVDMSAVDPLVVDEFGCVRQVRELAGKSISQVILGGDSGVSLRDLLAAAALLKSKRVPASVDLLFAPPSRQILEVLAQSGALSDLIATGARLLEPDQRLIRGELYPPPAEGLSLRTFDPEPASGHMRPSLIASAETLAFSVALGELADPRGFKRPVRVTLPRSLPTDDVLIVRKSKAKSKPGKSAAANGRAQRGYQEEPMVWKDAASLALVPSRKDPTEPSALLLESLDDVRWAERRAPRLAGRLRAVIAPHIPSGIVSSFSALGIMALAGKREHLKFLQGQSMLNVPAPAQCNGNEEIPVVAGNTRIPLRWLAIGAEREWAMQGTAHSKPKPGAKPRG